ncbi:MAG: hypothetical protein HY781_07020 [Chloroflexi bacterium]|nr:hypothetical protein [Chloroflexota bacterium]
MHLTTRQLFAILLFLGLFAMTLRPVADPDFWWHLRTGQLITETGTIPHSDPFSYTLPGKAWIAHEWLTEFVFYSLYRTGGFGLLIITFSLIITASFLLVYLRSPGRPYAAGFTVLLAALASAPTWGVRPQMVSLLLTAAFLFFLDKFQEKQRWQSLLLLPLLTVLWVNLHAGYFLGFAVIGLHIIGEAVEILKALSHRERPSLRPALLLSAALAACVLAALANPNTTHILTYPFETLTSNSMMQFIQEWFSPDFHQPEWIPLAVLILSLIALPLLARRPVPLTRVLLAVSFGFAALRSMRFVPLFALTAVPLLAEQLAGLARAGSQVRPPPRFSRWLNPLVVILVLLASGLRFVSVLQEQPKSEAERTPLAAADWILENRPAGNLYNAYGWGGYLIWRLYPDYPVYIDGRADVYGDEFIYDYLRIYYGQPGWEHALEEAGVRLALVEPGSGLENTMRQSADWRLAYEDTLSVLFVRK